jgi:hypothetical protein
LSSNSPVLTAYDSHEAQIIPIVFVDTSITSSQRQAQGLGLRVYEKTMETKIGETLLLR